MRDGDRRSYDDSNMACGRDQRFSRNSGDRRQRQRAPQRSQAGYVLDANVYETEKDKPMLDLRRVVKAFQEAGREHGLPDSSAFISSMPP